MFACYPSTGELEPDSPTESSNSRFNETSCLRELGAGVIEGDT